MARYHFFAAACAFALTLPPALAPAGMTDAPAQCGAWFLYWHPAWTAKKGYERDKAKYKIISVSTTPPDDGNAAVVEQVFAFGIGKRGYLTDRPRLFGEETHKRNRMTPVRLMDVMGEYVNGNLCKPYKPSQLSCRPPNTWCNYAE